MKVLIINGSPKGEYSITLHTALFLQKRFPECTFEILHVGKKIKSIEKDMSSSLKLISESDLIVFTYPVYTFLVPAQLHRFIELVHESGVSFKGKFATQIMHSQSATIQWDRVSRCMTTDSSAMDTALLQWAHLSPILLKAI